MPTDIRLWQIEDEKPKQIFQQKLNLEARLENWIRDDIDLISSDLLIIGQQVPTAYGGAIDLLAMDSLGNLAILELKRDKTPRDIVAQVLDYASWIQDLGHDDIEEIARGYFKDTTLEQVFKNRFGSDLPDFLNERHRMYVVASSLDSSTERIVKYLSETHDVDINVATFAYFNAQKSEFLGRSMLLDEEDVQNRAESKSKRKPPKSFEELRSMAVDNGIVDLYDKALSELKPICDSLSRSRSTVAFIGHMGENKSLNTIISLFPGKSSSEEGLAIFIYVDRLCEYFNIQENSIREIIGKPGKDANLWAPQQTYYLNPERLDLFISLLKEAK